jgi:hypothetical protein
MSRVLVIGSDNQVSREIGSALPAAGFPIEYSAGHARRPQPVAHAIVTRFSKSDPCSGAVGIVRNEKPPNTRDH